MKKNYRIIPHSIENKLKGIQGNSIVVAVSKEYTKKEICNNLLGHIGITIKGDALEIDTPIMPPHESGRYSRKNLFGDVKILKDLPKIYRTIDMGERPIWGDWSKGSFDLYQRRRVYVRQTIPPKELSLSTEVLREEKRGNETYFLLKFSINYILSRKSSRFADDLLLCINLLQENIGASDVYSSSATNDEYAKAIMVNWDILPPGNKELIVERILKTYKNPSKSIKEKIVDRYEFFNSLKVKNFIYGLSGIVRYFGAEIKSDLVIFENLDYGNAIYFLYQDWRKTSQLSRSELLNLSCDKYLRIIHKGDWKAKVRHEIDRHLQVQSTLSKNESGNNKPKK